MHARPAGLYGIGKLYLERVYACSALCAAASQNGFCSAGGRRHITTTATSATPIVSVQCRNDTLHSTLACARSRECVCAHTHTHALSSLGGGEVKICAHTLIIMSIAVMRLKILINLFARNGRSAVRAQTRTHTHASADTFASAVAAASAAAVVGW